MAIMRHFLLWGLPILIGLSFPFFNIIIQVFTSQEQSFHAMRQEGWIPYLQEQEFQSSEFCQTPGVREGEMVIDTNERIWVVGNCNLTGVHFLDGVRWASLDVKRAYDLAATPNGQVFVAGNSLLVFDGQKWITFEEGELGIKDRYGKDDQQILQVEVDSNGRIWIVTNNYGVEQVAEIVIQQNKATAKFSHPEFTITNGEISSLDADNRGRLWASVQKYPNSDTLDEWAGLNVFDGEIWQHVPVPGIDLQWIVRTTFDNQGHAWVATECGGVMTYDGKDWVTIVAEDKDTSPYCFIGPRAIDGITLDNKGRVWTWYNDRVQLLLPDNTWKIFTPENSGLEDGVFGLVIDHGDRIWIGTRGGVVMADLEHIEPLPEKIVQQRRILLFLETLLLSGMDWFFPSVLAILWFGIYLGSIRGVGIAASVGMLFVIWSGFVMAVYSVSPVVVATFVGLAGGIVGGQIDKDINTSMHRWEIGLAIAGLILGFGIGMINSILHQG
jgi:ligand-binding sensor domain-containing protein